MSTAEKHVADNSTALDEQEVTELSPKAGQTNTTNEEEANQQLNKEESSSPPAHGDEPHSAAEHILHTKPFPLHTWVAQYPLPCCCFFFFWFLISIILVTSVPNILFFSTDVPFYIRGNDATSKTDALSAGRDDASWTRPADGSSATGRQESAAETTLQLIFQVLDGDTLMTERYLGTYSIHCVHACLYDDVYHTELMDEIQDKIKAATDYDKFCLLSNGVCVNEQTLTNFFDPEYFLPSQEDYKGANLSYTLEPSFNPNFVQFFARSKFINSTAVYNKDYSAANIDKVVQYWAEYDAGSGPPIDYSQKYYGTQKMSPKFYYQQSPAGQEYALTNMFASIADKRFAYDSPLSTDVDTALTIFSFGLYLEGYNTTDDNDDQENAIGEWCYENLQDVFTEFQKDHEDELAFYWDCGDIGM